MIVVGLEVHKHSLTAVAVDELGRAVAEQASAVNGEVVIEWARSLDAERLWALEDCRTSGKSPFGTEHDARSCDALDGEYDRRFAATRA